ncbi:MAG: protein-glutamate O-methyltransferase CheR [Halieaceae bacterium]|jgi:chemotaxis protein methyltransferase CheR|nr:protein-glutamate O-methyltransferase CheR [Halieaceae bacterium]
MLDYKITEEEFRSFQNFIYDHAGIKLSDQKTLLVNSRLASRLRHYSLDSFSQYFDLVMESPPQGERQVVTDLLTTNETYFFREPKHFAHLEKEVLPKWRGGRPFRVWSAASSTGEEAYSIAMLLDDMLGSMPWEIVGSDISSRVLKKAQQGLYQQTRIDGIPREYMSRYCLKGTGDYAGSLLIDKKLRQNVTFTTYNLKKPERKMGPFHIIFLRNVLIYFDAETTKQIINNLVRELHNDGLLFIGHSESIKGVHRDLEAVIPTVYRKTPGGKRK